MPPTSPREMGAALLAAAVLAAGAAPSDGLAARRTLSFVQPGRYQAEPVNTPTGLVTADFNGDGHLDVASSGVFSPDPDTTKPRGLPVHLGLQGCEC